VTTVSPYTLVKRIPEDQPFVVRNNPVKRLLVVGITWLVLELLLVVYLVTTLADADSGTTPVRAFLNFAVFSVFLLAVLGNSLGVLVYGSDPVLGMGPAGLWIRTKPVFGRAVWLPWESLLLISRRRWGFDRMLVVRVRDERIAQLSQPRGGFGYYRARQRSGFLATLNMADLTEAEILQAVAVYSANRVPLT
jgi:hypothetical protein